MTRAFIAIELQDEAREALRWEIARLRTALPDIRFVDPASLHLTLAFLGELDGVRLADAVAATDDAAAVTSPFAVNVAGIGTFGGPRAPRVIWSGVTGDVPALLAARSHLARALEAHGFAADARPFAPHLTLARLNDRLDAESVRRLEVLVRGAPVAGETAVPVEALSLMRSELLRSGARYTRLHTGPLAGTHSSLE